jgi:hypothetical protein
MRNILEEEVLKAVKCKVKKTGRCAGCMYRRSPTPAARETCDQTLLFSDVWELLKDKSPRVMTKEEVAGLKPGTDIYLEVIILNLYGSGKSRVMAGTVYYVDQNTISFLGFHSGYALKNYNQLWRVWTARPKQEHQDATEWDLYKKLPVDSNQAV